MVRARSRRSALPCRWSVSLSVSPRQRAGHGRDAARGYVATDQPSTNRSLAVHSYSYAAQQLPEPEPDLEPEQELEPEPELELEQEPALELQPKPDQSRSQSQRR